MSPRRNQFSFSCKRSNGFWLVMKPQEALLLYERDLFIIKKETGSPWSFFSAAQSKFVKNSQEEVAG